jgi:hypothetical protein
MDLMKQNIEFCLSCRKPYTSQKAKRAYKSIAQVCLPADGQLSPPQEKLNQFCTFN